MISGQVRKAARVGIEEGEEPPSKKQCKAKAKAKAKGKPKAKASSKKKGQDPANEDEAKNPGPEALPTDGGPAEAPSNSEAMPRDVDAEAKALGQIHHWKQQVPSSH